MMGEAKAAHKVLLVEDEPGLRFLTGDSLVNDGGFVVVEARTAGEAVEILKADPEINCVFTDVRMPGKFDGIDLSRHVLQTYPGLPVIVTSGNLRPGELQLDVPFLTKPYDLTNLSQTIHGLIDALKPQAL